MQFPDTEVTRETDAIMQAIAPFGTYSDTSKYNRAYEAIWTLLTDIAARRGFKAGPGSSEFCSGE